MIRLEADVFRKRKISAGRNGGSGEGSRRDGFEYVVVTVEAASLHVQQLVLESILSLFERFQGIESESNCLD